MALLEVSIDQYAIFGHKYVNFDHGNVNMVERTLLESGTLGGLRKFPPRKNVVRTWGHVADHRPT